MEFKKENKKNAKKLNKAIKKNDEELFKCILVKKKGFKRIRKHLYIKDTSLNMKINKKHK